MGSEAVDAGVEDGDGVGDADDDSEDDDAEVAVAGAWLLTLPLAWWNAAAGIRLGPAQTFRADEAHAPWNVRPTADAVDDVARVSMLSLRA